MKKLLNIIPVLVAVLAVSFVSCNGQTKGKVNLKTEIDSLSYASGIAMTDGIEQYFQQMGIAENTEDFAKGFKEGMKIKEDDKKSVAKMIGMQMGQHVANQSLPGMSKQYLGENSDLSINVDLFQAAFLASILNESTLMTSEEALKVTEELAEKLQAQVAEKAKEENAKFLEGNKTKEGVVALPSGLQYKVISEGTGAKPTAESKVNVDYHGTTIDGNVFDSSVDRGQPAEFFLNQVIPGWTEGLQLMSEGSKYTFYIPYDLAYGEYGRPGSIGPYATLIFEVTLHKIVE